MWEHAQSLYPEACGYWGWSCEGGRQLNVGKVDFLEKEPNAVICFPLPRTDPTGTGRVGPFSHPGSAAGPPGHPLWQTGSWGSG